ncbi:MAG: ribonuclease III [Porticoccaceae bacterium]|nr:ribonuclease III [Porticoccaceae bacterium]
MDINYQRLLTRIGHDFCQPKLLQQALTHRSYSAINNERLEFLGDAILGMVISHILYERFEKAQEGELSQLRASLVKGAVLAEVARELAIGEHLKLGGGEMKSGGARRDTILADAMEAIIGAIFLDAGIDACRLRITQWYSHRLGDLSVKTITKDAKTLLQEYLQGQGCELPAYQVIESTGDAHEQVFSVQCILSDSEQMAVGEGSSRKKAEQEAAQRMFDQLDRLESQAVRIAGAKVFGGVPVIKAKANKAVTTKKTTERDD